jgi:hypothetical protein
MSTFLYRCPHTGLTVQGWVADDADKSGEAVYEPVLCTVCARTHLVDPTTGRVLGVEDE